MGTLENRTDHKIRACGLVFATQMDQAARGGRLTYPEWSFMFGKWTTEYSGHSGDTRVELTKNLLGVQLGETHVALSRVALPFPDWVT